ncbi:MAG: S41 family peptidase [Aureispira sp.]
MAEYNPLSNREKITIFLPLVVTLALAGGTWLGFKLATRQQQSYATISEGGRPYSGKTSKVEEVMRFIDARYLETEDKNELEEAALEAVLDELDPHSSYISLDAIQGVNESLSGNFNGIGIEFYLLEDTIYVVGVIEGGPSDSAGLRRGDKIIAINDSIIAGKAIFNNDVINKLKGPAGSTVELDIKRAGKKGTEKVTIRRGQIPMRSVLASYMVTENTGLIKINRFSGTTHEEFITALQHLVQDHQMEHLILDLRHNPGGYLNAATEMLDQLFDSPKLLVYTEGRSYRRKDYNSTGRTNFDISKVVVLINEGSASASEIMAGAIQDNDRGLIIGRRSFGKGLVQEQYKLSDGSALRLTVARYFTPSGRYIQKPYEDTEVSYSDDLRQRYESGELYSRDSIKMTDSTIYRTTNGRIVYGGGGIVPDIFIPLDTTRRNSYFQSMSIVAREYVYKYLDDKRDQLLVQHSTYEDFQQKYQVSEALLEQIVAYGESKEIPKDMTLMNRYKSTLQLEVKAYLADQIYGDMAYYQTVFMKDKMVARAVQEIDRTGSTTAAPSALKIDQETGI